MRHIRRLLLSGVGLAALIGGGVAAMTTVSASDYGSRAQYQVTISANTLPYPQASALGLPSGGFWIWIELDGT